MNNKLVIGFFILFLLIVFYSSLRTITHPKTSKNNPPINSILQNTLAVPSPTAYVRPTLQIQHPGFRVNGGDDD